MTAVELLTDLQRQGFTLTPLPEGKLAVKPVDKLSDELRQHIKQYKTEVLALLTSTPSWPCPACHGLVRLDPADMTILPTRLWTCPGCGAWGATREGAAFPIVWCSNVTVQ